MENDEPIESSPCDLIWKSCGKIQLDWFSSLFIIHSSQVDALLFVSFHINNDIFNEKEIKLAKKKYTANKRIHRNWVFGRFHPSMIKAHEI